MSHPAAVPLEAGTTLLHDAVILLGFALVFVLVFRRLGLGATLGFLIAGAVAGPQVLNLVAGAQSKLHFAELGIVLLLASLEWSPDSRQLLGNCRTPTQHRFVMHGPSDCRQGSLIRHVQDQILALRLHAHPLDFIP